MLKLQRAFAKSTIKKSSYLPQKDLKPNTNKLKNIQFTMNQITYLHLPGT